MNDTDEQTLIRALRNPPPIHPPETLERELISRIQLTKGKNIEAGTAKAGMRTSPFPWLVAAILAGLGLAAAGVQTYRWVDLGRKTDDLERRSANVETLRAANAEYQRLVVSLEDAAQWRRDADEVETLSAEIERLRARVDTLIALRDENSRLAAEPASLGGPMAGETDDFFSDKRAHAQSIKCINNMKNIGLAVRIYATDHDDYNPESVMQLKGVLSSPGMLICPSKSDSDQDTEKRVTWEDIHPGAVTYQL